MLINTAPADEIAEIRGQIRMLKDREAELRGGFLSGQHGLRGNVYEVSVKSDRRRTFLRDKLPPRILNDPTYWADKVTQTVTVKEYQPFHVAADDFDVFEPFD